MFLRFDFDAYYPAGAMDDLTSTHASLAEACASSQRSCDYAQVAEITPDGPVVVAERGTSPDEPAERFVDFRLYRNAFPRVGDPAVTAVMAIFAETPEPLDVGPEWHVRELEALRRYSHTASV